MPVTKYSSKMRNKRVPRASRSSGTGGMAMQYALALAKPTLIGAKIPDTFANNTCTVQLEKEFTIQASDGCLSSIIDVGIFPTDYKSVGGDWFLKNSAQRIATAAPCDGVGQTSFRNLFKSARVVSAGLRYDFSGNDAGNQGVVTLAVIDSTFLQSRADINAALQGDIDNLSNVATPWIDAQMHCSVIDWTTCVGATSSTNMGELLRALPKNAYGPIKLGGQCRYFPNDNNDLEWRTIPIVPATADLSQYALSKVGNVAGFFLVGEGLATGASIVCKLTVNVECCVRSDALHLVSASPGPVSVTALAQAAQICSRLPACNIGGNTNAMPVYGGGSVGAHF